MAKKTLADLPRPAAASASWSASISTCRWTRRPATSPTTAASAAALPTIQQLLDARRRRHRHEPPRPARRATRRRTPAFSMDRVAARLRRAARPAGQEGVDEVVGPAGRRPPRRRSSRATCCCWKTCASTPASRRTIPSFAAALAALGDVYVNDAFGTCHNDKDASMVAVPAAMKARQAAGGDGGGKLRIVLLSRRGSKQRSREGPRRRASSPGQWQSPLRPTTCSPAFLTGLPSSSPKPAALSIQSVPEVMRSLPSAAASAARRSAGQSCGSGRKPTTRRASGVPGSSSRPPVTSQRRSSGSSRSDRRAPADGDHEVVHPPGQVDARRARRRAAGRQLPGAVAPLGDRAPGSAAGSRRRPAARRASPRRPAPTACSGIAVDRRDLGELREDGVLLGGRAGPPLACAVERAGPGRAGPGAARAGEGRGCRARAGRPASAAARHQADASAGPASRSRAQQPLHHAARRPARRRPGPRWRHPAATAAVRTAPSARMPGGRSWSSHQRSVPRAARRARRHRLQRAGVQDDEVGLGAGELGEQRELARARAAARPSSPAAGSAAGATAPTAPARPAPEPLEVACGSTGRPPGRRRRPGPAPRGACRDSSSVRRPARAERTAAAAASVVVPAPPGPVNSSVRTGPGLSPRRAS